MKKRSSWPYAVLAVGVVAGGVLGCQSRSANAVPSDAVTKTVTVDGFGGPMTVEVTATADKLYSVNITENAETDGIGSNAVSQLPGAMVEANSIAVDSVSGATVSSDAIKKAVAQALTEAGFDATKFGGTVEAETEAAAPAAEGEIPADAVVGTGSATGFGGELKVEVTATAERIYKVVVTENAETQGIGSKAIDALPGAMVEANSIAVDSVGGATISSGAIVEAVKAALADAGLDASVFETAGAGAAAAAAEDASYDADIVIIGAGGAGMTAAIEAADAGKTVILVESQAMVGGNSVRATGGMNAADTSFEDANEFGEEAGVEKTLKSAADTYADHAEITELAKTVQEQWDAYQAAPDGYFDSVELMELDTMIGGKGLNDIDLVKALAENSGDGIDWLSSIGADLHNVGAFGGASVKRIHRPVNAEGKTTAVGAYMIPILEENLTKREGITLLTETTAEEILMEDGKAVGIKASGKSGNEVIVNAQAVVVTTGGFGANSEMVVSYKPELDGFMTTNAPGIKGQGIQMAEAVGAATVDMEQIQIHPTVEANTAALITEGLRGDGAILVNANGERFFDEVGTRDAVSAAEIAQPGSFAWLVIDQKMVDASAVIQGYIKKGYTFTGESAEELAKAIEVPEEALAATLEKWNANVEAKTDADFGRTSFANPLDTAPYYAIKVSPGVHHTMGGLKINANTEVLDQDDNVISGLFAAGEVTGGVHGANRLGGNAVTDFTVFGRIAGQNAAKAVS